MLKYNPTSIPFHYTKTPKMGVYSILHAHHDVDRHLQDSDTRVTTHRVTNNFLEASHKTIYTATLKSLSHIAFFIVGYVFTLVVNLNIDRYIQ